MQMDNSVSIMALGGWGFPMFGKNAMAYDGDSIWDLWIDIGGEG
jgi:hypothetical protein